MIKTRTSRKIIKSCAGCAYCNTICPTASNPYGLIREIRLQNYNKNGVRCTSLITEEIPHNLMSIGLGINTETKKQDLKNYENPSKSNEMFMWDVLFLTVFQISQKLNYLKIYLY